MSVSSWVQMGMQRKYLMNNGKVDAGTGGDMDTQILLGQIPMFLHDSPEEVMVIGLGSGITAGSVLQNPLVKNVDLLEISPEVVEASDFSASTSAMIREVERSDAPNYLLLTECSMGDNIAAANPDKEMLRLCSVRCPHMNEITLEQTRNALLYDHYPVDVPEDIRVRARLSIDRMLEIG